VISFHLLDEMDAKTDLVTIFPSVGKFCLPSMNSGRVSGSLVQRQVVNQGRQTAQYEPSNICRRSARTTCTIADRVHDKQASRLEFRERLPRSMTASGSLWSKESCKNWLYIAVLSHLLLLLTTFTLSLHLYQISILLHRANYLSSDVWPGLSAILIAAASHLLVCTF
jgi:hypothetical protein